MSNSKSIRETLIQIKPEIVKCSGFGEAFRKVQMHFPDDDIQRITCEKNNKGEIAAWEMLIDVLKSCGKDAFVQLWDVINTERCFTEIRENFEEICRSEGLLALKPQNSEEVSYIYKDNQSGRPMFSFDTQKYDMHTYVTVNVISVFEK